MESAPDLPLQPYKSNRRILIISGPKELEGSALAPHEVLFTKSLDSSLEVIGTSRPDLVIYFTKGKTDDLEEHVMTWLIEGFRGKFLLFDPLNRVNDFHILMESQVVDEYLSGPVSPSRFASIIKSQLSHDIRFASPRAMTTFDLFRNLFDRGLNAIFFFDQDLNRCIAANLCAEQITGYSLFELRHLGLRDLCLESEYQTTLGVIRRASRHYYDARGTASLKNRKQRPMEISFSCGVFNFGRKSFVKLEVQSVADASNKSSGLSSRADSFRDALERGFVGGAGKQAPLTLILCKLQPATEAVLEIEKEEKMLQKVGRVLEENFRKTDTVGRLAHYLFGILLPNTLLEQVEKTMDRLRIHLSALPEIKRGLYLFEISRAHCPQEAYPFMHLLRSTELPANPSPFRH